MPDLDLLIEGGFPVGKSYLVTGEQGSGKTLFCIQFILNGLLGGEKAVYVTVNEKPADIIAEANSLGWSLLKFVEEKKLLILDASPLLSASTNRASKSGEPDVAKTISDLASYVKKMEASRLVIDPVDSLIGSADSSSATQEHTRTLVHALQDQIETTNLLTSNSFSGNSIGAAGGQGIPVNGVVVLGFSRKLNGLTRTLLVSKMRETAIDLIEYSFDIVKERGIVLNPIIPEALPTPETPIMSETPAAEIPEADLSKFKEWEP
ncbi:MAG: ATPase domain-containing protein [Nitrososphaerales archaeon]